MKERELFIGNQTNFLPVRFSQLAWRHAGKSSSPFNAWGPANANYPQNQGSFHLCRKWVRFQEPGQKLCGERKIFSVREKCFSFCSEKKQKNLQIFTVPWQFSPKKVQSSKKLYYHRNVCLLKNRPLNIDLAKQKLFREVQL